MPLSGTDLMSQGLPSPSGPTQGHRCHVMCSDQMAPCTSRMPGPYWNESSASKYWRDDCKLGSFQVTAQPQGYVPGHITGLKDHSSLLAWSEWPLPPGPFEWRVALCHWYRVFPYWGACACIRFRISDQLKISDMYSIEYFEIGWFLGFGEACFCLTLVAPVLQYLRDWPFSCGGNFQSDCHHKFLWQSAVVPLLQERKMLCSLPFGHQ